MALTRVAPAGIGSTPGTGYVIGDSFLHSRGVDTIDGNYTGIVTTQSLRVLGDLQVDGTTTTLDTALTEVDKLEVGANNNTVGVAITQSGTGDILNLFDGSTEVFTVLDGGNVGINTLSPSEKLDVVGNIVAKEQNPYIKIQAGTTGSPYLRFDQDATRKSFLRYQNIGQFDIVNEYGDVTFWTGTSGSETQKMTVTSSGNVGIGSAIPDATLDLLSSTTKIQLSPNGVDKAVIHDGNRGDLILSADDSGTNGASSIQFKVDGSEKLRITSSGHVGIGTNIPSHELDIESTSPTIELKDSDNDYTFQLTQSGSATYVDFDTDGGGSSSLRIRNAYDEKIRIQSDGKVGIGTNSPDYSLTIGDGSSYVIQNLKAATNEFCEFRFGDTDSVAQGKITYDHNDDSLRFTTNASEKLRISSDGNIGIGTDNPTSKLHVNGGVLVKGPATPNINFSPLSGGSGNADISFDGNDLRIVSNSSSADVRINAYSRDNDFVLKQDGKIGIGTDNPQGTLSVGGNISLDVALGTIPSRGGITRHTNGYTYFIGKSDGAGAILNNGDGTATVRAENPGGSAGFLLFETGNGSEKLRITSAGKIGINTSTPIGDVTIYTTNNGYIDFSGSGGKGAEITFHNRDDKSTTFAIQNNGGSNELAQYVLNSASATHIWYCGGQSASNEKLRLTSNGRLGIGTDNPSTYKLDINHLYTEQGLRVRSRYGNIATAMVRFDTDPYSDGGDGNVLHIHGGNSRTDSEILQVDSTGCGNIFQIRGDGLIKQTLTKNNFTESHWYNHTTNGYIIEYDNNDVLTLTKNVDTANYNTICYRRITMSKNCDIEFDLKGNSPNTTHRHVGFVINGDGGNDYTNMDRLVFRYRPSSTSQNQIRLDAGGGGSTFSQISSSIPNFFDGTYRHILIQIRDRTFRIYSDGVLVNSYRASADLVRSSGWFGVSIYEASTSGTPTISIKNFSIRNEIIKPNFLVKATGVNVDVTAGNNLPFNSIEHDRDGNYNTSSYYFTAPVHGLYYFFVNAYRNSSGGTRISLYKNNTEILICRPVPNGGDFVFHTSGMILLAKDDTVSVVAGDLFDNFYGNSDQRFSSFGGYLVD